MVQEFWTVGLCEKKVFEQIGSHQRASLWVTIEESVGMTAVCRKVLVSNALNITLQLILCQTSQSGLDHKELVVI